MYLILTFACVCIVTKGLPQLLISLLFTPGGKKNHEQNEEWWGWKNGNQRYTWKLTSVIELQRLNDDINYIGNNADTKG